MSATLKLQINNTQALQHGLSLGSGFAIVINQSIIVKPAGQYEIQCVLFYYSNISEFEAGKGSLNGLLDGDPPIVYSIQYNQTQFDALNLDVNGSFAQVETDVKTFLEGIYGAGNVISI